jgi:hypothetical protein
MQLVSRRVIWVLSQFRVIFQITALERSDILDCSRSLHCLPLVVLRHVTAAPTQYRGGGNLEAGPRLAYRTDVAPNGVVVCTSCASRDFR